MRIRKVHFKRAGDYYTLCHFDPDYFDRLGKNLLLSNIHNAITCKGCQIVMKKRIQKAKDDLLEFAGKRFFT